VAVIIVCNTIAIILLTVRPIAEQFEPLLRLIINFCMVIFVAEYLLRIWACPTRKCLICHITDRVRYTVHPYLLIDLISILPVFIPFLMPHDFMLIRLLRLVSIFKLGRFTQYSESLYHLKQVLRRKKEIFAIMLFFLVFIILFSSTIMYVVEYPAQPESFSSIPAALWWSVMTVTTVGYGDIAPITPLGKFIAGVVTLTGVLILALPSAIMASGFIEERERHKNSRHMKRAQGVPHVLIYKLKELKEHGYISDEEYALFLSHLSGDETIE